MSFQAGDLLKSNRIAFSLQRIWIQFIGLLIGYIGYLILTYMSIVIAGYKLGDMWSTMGLFPCLARVDANWLSWIVYMIGVLFLLCIYLITATANSRAAYMLLKGNNFYSWREAYSFSLKKLNSVIFSPVAVLVILGLILLFGVFVGLLGKIPYIGELGISLFYLIWLLVGLLIVFILFVLVAALLYTPSIIATTDDDTFEAVFQTFSMVWNQPWRLIFYSLIVLGLSCLSFLGFSFFLKKSLSIIDFTLSAIMADKYINIINQANFLCASWVVDSIYWMKGVLGRHIDKFYISEEFLQLELTTFHNITAHILSIMLILMGFFVAAYTFATLNVGQTISYLIIRKSKDDENLLDRIDQEEELDEEDIDSTNT